MKEAKGWRSAFPDLAVNVDLIVAAQIGINARVRASFFDAGQTATASDPGSRSFLDSVASTILAARVDVISRVAKSLQRVDLKLAAGRAKVCPRFLLLR
jgi:hypothetical protein